MEYTKSFKRIRLVLTLLGAIVGGVVGFSIFLNRPAEIALVVLTLLLAVVISALVWFFTTFLYRQRTLAQQTVWPLFRDALKGETTKDKNNEQLKRRE